MRVNSLAARLVLVAIGWAVAILLGTGLVLSSLYRETVERAFDRRLSVYLKTLVADVAVPEPGQSRAPELGEALFQLPLSGWYWQVTRLDGENREVRSSRSLWDATLPSLAGMGVPPRAEGLREGYLTGPDQQRLRVIERAIDLGEDGRYLVAVAGDAAEIEDEANAFDRALAVTFGLLALGLALATLVQVRVGLSPLKRISEQLAAIRSGAAERLAGAFPREIAPLAREVNALIEANREIVERARTHVGNLAHGLKTPLSVIVNEAAGRDDPMAAKVTEQAGIMKDQIARHLERARMAARITVVGTVTDVEPVVASLARTMEKIHRDRALAIEARVPAQARFRGERQDLEEIVGNLLDNACKWATGEVAVIVTEERPADPADRAWLRLIVDDDGPGLSEAERARVLKRGERLDETKPGSGLGLSIVREVVALYGGRFALGEAPAGGLRAEVTLPAA